jgi:16S rRNA C967 or C1407 C5-methylase (RsmB/RsmF family)
MTDESVLSRLKALEQQRVDLIESTKAEALGNATAAVKTLNDLGFAYRLVEGEKKPNGSRKRTRVVKDAPCSVCGFKTKPPHDRRTHRMQGGTRQPFTDAELAKLGLARV